MKLYSYENNGIEISIEDDCKEKETSIDAHIEIRRHVWSLDRKEYLLELLEDINKLSTDLEWVKIDIMKRIADEKK